MFKRLTSTDDIKTKILLKFSGDLKDKFKNTKKTKVFRFIMVITVFSVLGVIGSTKFLSVYAQGYEVKVNGVPVAVVDSSVTLSEAIDDVQQQASEVLGKEYNLNDSIVANERFVPKEQLKTRNQLFEILMEQIGGIEQCYILEVDDTVIATNENPVELEEVLDELKLPYTTDNTVETNFVQDVKISYDYVSMELEKDISDIEQVLSDNIEEATTYIVVKGDTYSDIALKFNMSLNQLMNLNPQASLDKLMIGDVLNIKKEVPFLSISTIDKINYTQPISSPIEYVDDSNLYIGDTKIVEQGSDGEELVKALVTKVNGYEESRKVVESTVITEPKTTTIAKGTTPRPKTASYGTYIWPVSGRVTSTTGNRYLFGSTNYHAGLDIAAPYGTTVKASDGGKVTFAGWKGDYGNLVIITHDNGTKTYYAHNSSLIVSEGDKVYQGQAIAKVGATGQTTGNHSHFEVRVGGKIENPYNYLP